MVMCTLLEYVIETKDYHALIMRPSRELCQIINF